MLQSWLFFELLKSVFQENFPSRRYISQVETDSDTFSRWVLNTKNLRAYYKSWHLNFLDLLSRSFARSLHSAGNWALYLTVKLGIRTIEYKTLLLSTALNATILTTLLLTESLRKARLQGFLRNSFVNKQMDLDPGNEIEDMMWERKRCPSSFNVSTNNYGRSATMYTTLQEPAENTFV